MRKMQANSLVDIKGKNVFCDSSLVAEKFKKEHKYIIKKIEALIKDVNKIKGEYLSHLNFIPITKEYRGQKYKAYLMDRESFSLLAMKFSGKKALEWQVKFNNAFYEMEKRLLIIEQNNKNSEWVAQREQGKLARKSEIDIIKEFVDYATAQGSKNAKHYYKHITMACNRCLQLIEGKKPKLRDTLNLMELSQLMIAENIVEKSLKKWMAEGEHYKAIFVLAKQAIEDYARTLMLNEIVKPKRLI